MKCPQCKNRVLQKSGSITRVRIDGPLLLDEQGRARSKCYWCKADLELPLRLAEGVSVETERYYLGAAKPSS